MREGLADSVNTVAVRLTMEAGRWRVVRTARRLGIESEIQKNLSIALGTSEVTLLELVSAYAPFANGGYIATPHIVNRIQTPKGKVLYQRRTTGRPRAVALPYVAAMNDMMGATMVSGTARSAALPDRPAAGKTGTTQNFRDAWFIGYTAHYVGGVWIGNDDGKPMKRVTGGTLPAGMWKKIMLTAHRKDKQAASLPGARHACSGPVAYALTERAAPEQTVLLRPGSRSAFAEQLGAGLRTITVQAARHSSATIDLARSVCGQTSLHMRPETRAVVHLPQMRHFMRGEIVEHVTQAPVSAARKMKGRHPPSRTPSGLSGRAP